MCAEQTILHSIELPSSQSKSSGAVTKTGGPQHPAERDGKLILRFNDFFSVVPPY